MSAEVLAASPRVGEPYVPRPVARAWRLQLPMPVKTALSQYRVAVWADDEGCRVHDDLTAAAEEPGLTFLRMNLEGCRPRAPTPSGV